MLKKHKVKWLNVVLTITYLVSFYITVSAAAKETYGFSTVLVVLFTIMTLYLLLDWMVMLGNQEEDNNHRW